MKNRGALLKCKPGRPLSCLSLLRFSMEKLTLSYLTMAHLEEKAWSGSFHALSLLRTFPTGPLAFPDGTGPLTDPHVNHSIIWWAWAYLSQTAWFPTGCSTKPQHTCNILPGGCLSRIFYADTTIDSFYTSAFWFLLITRMCCNLGLAGIALHGLRGNDSFATLLAFLRMSSLGGMCVFFVFLDHRGMKAELASPYQACGDSSFLPSQRKAEMRVSLSAWITVSSTRKDNRIRWELEVINLMQNHMDLRTACGLSTQC